MAEDARPHGRLHGRSVPATLGDLLAWAADRRGDADAVLVDGDRVGFRALYEEARDFAGVLLGHGVRAGDHVGVLLPNDRAFFSALFGTALVGGICVPFNARYRAPELRYILEHSDVAFLLTTDEPHLDFHARLEAAVPELAAQSVSIECPSVPRLRTIVSLRASSLPCAISYEVALSSRATVADVAAASERVRSTDDVLMLYTSGTTADPKAALLRHEALILNGRGAAERLDLTESDRVWNPLPLFHVGGIVTATAAFGAGACILTSSHFEPLAALRTMRKERATVAYAAFPAIIGDLLDARGGCAAVDTVHTVTAVGPRSLLERLGELFRSARTANMFGATETCGIISYNRVTDDAEQRLTTCGHPYDGITVRVVDPASGLEVAAGEEGELHVKGYCVTSGYYKDPAATSRAIDAGWYRTGDLASLDVDGRIVFRGRLKDMLKVGGENVAAVEVEDCLGLHPAVKLAQVVGRHDQRLDEVPVAFVELRPGMTASAEELTDFCRERLARFKVPREVHFVLEWPMSATKVQKHKLKARLAQT